jgi:hypothetical protein
MITSRTNFFVLSIFLITANFLNGALAETSQRANEILGAMEMIHPLKPLEPESNYFAIEIITGACSYLLQSPPKTNDAFFSKIQTQFKDYTEERHKIVATLQGLEGKKETELLPKDAKALLINTQGTYELLFGAVTNKKVPNKTVQPAMELLAKERAALTLLVKLKK